MFDWLIQQQTGDLVVVGTGIGALVGAVGVGLRGVVKGKPTPAAVVAAIESIPACGAPEMVDELRGVKASLRDQRDLLDRMNDTLIRLEDRTRRT